MQVQLHQTLSERATANFSACLPLALTLKRKGMLLVQRNWCRNTSTLARLLH
jgi:hypothetical protein